jgi:hypothetical protein
VAGASKSERRFEQRYAESITDMLMLNLMAHKFRQHLLWPSAAIDESRAVSGRRNFFASHGGVALQRWWISALKFTRLK